MHVDAEASGLGPPGQEHVDAEASGQEHADAEDSGGVTAGVSGQEHAEASGQVTRRRRGPGLYPIYNLYRYPNRHLCYQLSYAARKVRNERVAMLCNAMRQALVLQ